MTVRDRIHISHERMSYDFGGGSGGRPSPDAMCEPGSVAIGFHVQVGQYFNEAWLDCARLRPNGWVGEERSMTQRTGSRGGHRVQDAYCGEGRVLRGLQGRTGASIDEAAGECVSIRELLERPNPRVEMTQSVRRPDAGGHPAEVQCPPGAVVTGFRSRSGAWMDHLWIVCSEVRGER
ncbi:MAG: hypothetical protein DMG79_21770 [Acidobacteria bacterium]|nr:MAG: hypothetical protein DMG79_21770 [Acidobacteriota bacterium]